jgi:hypothetical protein
MNTDVVIALVMLVVAAIGGTLVGRWVGPPKKSSGPLSAATIATSSNIGAAVTAAAHAIDKAPAKKGKP